MIKLLLISTIIVCFSNSTTAQYSDTIIKYYNHKWEEIDNKKRTHYSFYKIAFKDSSSGIWIVKDFYGSTNEVQMEGFYKDDSLKVKNGRFYYYHPNGIVSRSVFYINDKKVGLAKSFSPDSLLVDTARYNMDGIPIGKASKWTKEGNVTFIGLYDNEGLGTGYEIEYFENGIISSYGKYTEGYIMDSIWTYYHDNGNVAMLEEYDSGRLIMYKCFDINGIEQKDCDTVTKKADAPYDVYKYLSENTRFPDVIKESGVSGKMIAVLGFKVDVNGNIKNIELVRKSFPAINKEAYRVVNTFPRWNPSIHKNRAVETYHTIPITFIIK